MIRYWAAAIGLRLFSMNAPARSAYRSIGNIVGQKRRKRQDISEYVARGDLLVRLVAEYLGKHEKLAVLELGTGWIHWFGLYLALHIDKPVMLELFDVWDNRQLDALKTSFESLRDYDSRNKRGDPRIVQKLDEIGSVSSFDELYSKFSAKYFIESDGRLDSYESQSMDLVFSFHVLEHVHRMALADSVKNMFRVLKPGGYSIHQVGIDDHLAHYDRSQSKKTYIEYSLAARRRLFENIVQYHNVFQPKDYFEAFEQAGFEVVDVDRGTTDISKLKVNDDWQSYSEEDLSTTILTMVCRKPVEEEFL